MGILDRFRPRNGREVPREPSEHLVQENRRIIEVVNGEKLVKIKRLWSEFSQLKKSNFISTGLLAEEVGLIVNDSVMGTSVVNPSPTGPSYPFDTLIMSGKRVGMLTVRVYETGITVAQLSENPDFEYYTMIDSAVTEANKVLEFFWPEQEFVFVYGTYHKERLITNHKVYLSKPNARTDYFDQFLIVKTCPFRSDPNMIRTEFIWDNGDMYAMDYTINKPFEPKLTKIDKSLL